MDWRQVTLSMKPVQPLLRRRSETLVRLDASRHNDYGFHL
jgi:hypothetical protein